MKIIIRKKGIIDCTSDPREYEMKTLVEGIEGAIKIVDKEVLKIAYAEFYVGNNCKLSEHKTSRGIIEVNDKDVCLRLLDYFRNSPDELGEGFEYIIHIHVDIWNFFNDGNGCSDYIDIHANQLEVSCQDDYDPDMREEFHENIEKLLGSDYATVIFDKKLISLHVCVTEKCSANCNTCYVNRGLGRELEINEWDKLPLAAQYALGGGEPAEYPLIAELVDYLKSGRKENDRKENDRKGYVAITTNGQQIINFNTLPDKIAVSIDGLTSKIHNLTHATDLNIAESAAEYYRNKDINVCINHIVNKENIDDAERFAKIWNDKGYEVNFILFAESDIANNKNIRLMPTYEQLKKFNDYLRAYKGENTIEENMIVKDDKIMIDSCMGGLLSFIGGSNDKCVQGLFSKYYRYGIMTPCSHSSSTFPNCKVMEEYLIHYFRTLRPIIFIYDKDGTSGAHEWAYRSGYRGRIIHKVDNPLRKDVIYILTYDEEKMIKEPHYTVRFEDKMPYQILKTTNKK